MLTPNDLHAYQREAIIHQLTHDDSMLWLGTGLGKTISTLTTIVDRMRAGQVRKTLIVGPLRVIQSVWANEAAKWSHTQHLRFKILTGTKSERTRKLHEPADIYLINYESLSWFVETYTSYYLPFEMVVFDEISKMKNAQSIRVNGGKRDKIDATGKTYVVKHKGWRLIMNDFKYRTGLTGTPASNGLIDLHGQYLVIDGGKRLYPYITHFRDAFFKSDHMGWKHHVTDLGRNTIQSRISDITIKMDSNEYLDMPVAVVTDITVELPAKARTVYDEMEAEMFSKLDNGTELEVFSKSSVSNKCCQIANGCAYLPDSTDYGIVHTAKLDALDSVMEEAAGQPVLVSYVFKSDAEQIMKRFKKYRPINLSASRSSDTGAIIDKWRDGDIKMMVAHPACLHPDIEVLTDRGWLPLISVTKSDKIFDGIYWVNHGGVVYSGFKEVIITYGMIMTPNHQLLVDEEWVMARDINKVEPWGERPFGSRFSRVYDIVNAGPIHRFMIRNKNGETFISHNSVGHGIDGLQDRGHIVVWYGLNWSLELYMQMNARLDRQGQKKTVSIIRIIAANTVDLAVTMALENKCNTQEGLKNALQQYRRLKNVAF